MKPTITNRKKGACLAMLSALFYSLISVCVKWIGGTLPTVEVLFFRGAVMLVVASGTMLAKGQRLSGEQRPLLILRGFSGVLGAFTYYAAVARAPLAETMALVNLSPFVVTVLAAVFLKERLRKGHIAALLVSFAGALCIIRPSFSQVDTGYLIAFASAVITGCSYTMVRKLKQSVATPTIVFYYNIVTVLAAFPVMMLGGFVMPSWTEWVKLLCLGISALLFNYFNTSAYKYAPAGEISIYNYLSVIFSSAFGVLLWKEHLVAGTLAGIALILGGAYLSFRSDRASAALSSGAET
ncbi:DMT family transporter [Oscillospiraceae bacterium 50-60]